MSTTKRDADEKWSGSANKGDKDSSNISRAEVEQNEIKPADDYKDNTTDPVAQDMRRSREDARNLNRNK